VRFRMDDRIVLVRFWGVDAATIDRIELRTNPGSRRQALMVEVDRVCEFNMRTVDR
jgi:hypothetical protein